MAAKSDIEWTDATWTPIRARNLKTGKVGWYCEHASDGCKFCYAEGMNKRLGTGLPFKPGHRKDVEIFLDETMLTAPLRWRRPRMIFVCSMTDAFADFVKDKWLDKMFAVMALCPQHTFQVLTKRSARMRAYFAEGRERMHTRWLWAARDTFQNYAAGAAIPGDFPLRNAWLGVSAERQQEANERIPELLITPAAVRFVSLEPLLGPITLGADTEIGFLSYLKRHNIMDDTPTNAIDWIIVGGESGPNARPMHPQWARDIRDQCAAAGKLDRFFFKQWGAYAHETRPGTEVILPDLEPNQRALWGDGATNHIVATHVGKTKAGRLLDGIEHNGMPA